MDFFWGGLLNFATRRKSVFLGSQEVYRSISKISLVLPGLSNPWGKLDSHGSPWQIDERFFIAEGRKKRSNFYPGLFSYDLGFHNVSSPFRTPEFLKLEAG